MVQHPQRVVACWCRLDAHNACLISCYDTCNLVRKHEAGDVYDGGTSHRQQLCKLVERQIAMHRAGFPSVTVW
jgi:hypothetical protein